MRPENVLVLPEALNYPGTTQIMDRFKQAGIPVTVLANNRVDILSGEPQRDTFYAAKRMVVLAVRKREKLQSCRPSAHYQLPQVSGCPGHCQYCYLNTTFGYKPYIRLYVNRQEILDWADEYCSQRKPFVTIFEGAATSDPVPLEPWSGSLRQTIEYFAQHPYGRFRFVTKFDDIDTLLDADHRYHTRIRFTINSETVVKNWDKATTSLDRRLKAAVKIAEAGYLYGFLVGPVIVHEGWEAEYTELFEKISDMLPRATFKLASVEIVTHRFTPKAKEIIQNVYPATTLNLSEEGRRWKHGQFGYGKWVYPNDVYAETQRLFTDLITRYMPGARLMYQV